MCIWLTPSSTWRNIASSGLIRSTAIGSPSHDRPCRAFVCCRGLRTYALPSCSGTETTACRPGASSRPVRPGSLAPGWYRARRPRIVSRRRFSGIGHEVPGPAELRATAVDRVLPEDADREGGDVERRGGRHDREARREIAEEIADRDAHPEGQHGEDP